MTRVGRLIALLLALSVLAPPATEAGSDPVRATVEDFARPLTRWQNPGGSIRRTKLAGEPALALPRGGRLTRGLTGGGGAAVSLDLRLTPGSSVGLFSTSDGTSALTVRRTGTAVVASSGNRRWTIRRRGDGRRIGATQHLEAAVGPRLRLEIDGVPVGPLPRPARSFDVRVRKGQVVLGSFISSSSSDPRALLLHRLAAIRALTPPGRFPLGVGSDGTTRFHPGWTRGFWPGALWQAAALTPRSDTFSRWALRATELNFGAEDADTHDLGFMYGRSSVTAYERLCGTPRTADATTCARLRTSALRAADSLAALARTNEVAGMIPTRSATLCRGCESLGDADTIIDSMMNLSLLLWAARESPERAGYRDIAMRHAQGVTRYLVRPDGSTAQAVHVRRADGQLLFVHTHQGLSDASTWSRGQGWAIYGFAETAASTESPELLQVAERTAAFVESRDPLGLVPPYDYDAPTGVPTDTSAAVITAAGLFRLEDACRRLSRCDGRGARWGALADRLLSHALESVSTQPPLGLFGGQVFSLGGSSSWDDDGEFTFGLDYALEAIARAERE